MGLRFGPREFESIAFEAWMVGGGWIASGWWMDGGWTAARRMDGEPLLHY